MYQIRNGIIQTLSQNGKSESFESGMYEIDKRALYLDRLMGLRGSPDIKIITGVRRSGKSKLIEAMRTLLLSADDVNVIYIDLLDLSNEPLHEYHALISMCFLIRRKV